MACNSMLVLCGDTYATRLWCVWELFSLFAFSSKNQAERRIKFVPLLRPSQTAPDMLQSLKRFRLSASHCFDPNEEARLRDIIHARGEALFEGRIRELGEACERKFNLGTSDRYTLSDDFCQVNSEIHNELYNIGSPLDITARLGDPPSS